MSKDMFVEVHKVGLEAILEKVSRQASDPGLWVNAETPVEAYLQAELRYLHAIIEQVLGVGEVNPMRALPPFWGLIKEAK